jgi:hypothetical protein
VFPAKAFVDLREAHRRRARTDTLNAVFAEHVVKKPNDLVSQRIGRGLVLIDVGILAPLPLLAL